MAEVCRREAICNVTYLNLSLSLFWQVGCLVVGNCSIVSRYPYVIRPRRSIEIRANAKYSKYQPQSVSLRYSLSTDNLFSSFHMTKLMKPFFFFFFFVGLFSV
ncbi:uncharacterized protein F4812DRAFT_439944 [Daldinia caldariorum]|uniref:uncharacterized protein n=1 Tax=Daldinia caldariorum TaxID=326644 RepID=UPI00200879A7|nr:uncharacterized protein F4812DRAFT_439944 [Daldinia caldariorum]KAI1465179.1 hypothetical protein F4812DRAFT_439944 [Daldinia caldariorum]